MYKFLKNYNLKYLRSHIEGYGYRFSIKDFLIETCFIIGIVLIISFVSKLKYECMAILVIITLIMIPTLILSWFKQSYQINRFKMLCDYLSNIIPIFMQKTKIRYSLEEIKDLTNGAMKKAINQAINYIDNNLDDINIHQTALEIIESEFPNSRVKSVHKLMLTIEAETSVNYHGVCENLYIDIENWIKRVYAFQKDLKNRRNKLVTLCIMTLVLNSMFVYLYVSNEYFIGFTDIPLYQISTTIFILSILITITIILTKLHGEWLVNDLNFTNEKYISEKYDYLINGKASIHVIDIVISGICIVIGAYYFIFKENYLLGSILMILAYTLINLRNIRYKNAYNVVKKSLEIEFPLWLKEISLSLNNLTVINAIEYSQKLASYPLAQEIAKFLKMVKKDPTSIKPFTEFLIEYDLKDATSAMKVLYSIQNIGKDEVKNQVSSLIIRNQEMLDKSEQIRNNDSICGIEAIGYIPVVIFSIEMMCSMFVLFSHMMQALSSAINF